MWDRKLYEERIVLLLVFDLLSDFKIVPLSKVSQLLTPACSFSDRVGDLVSLDLWKPFSEPNLIKKYAKINRNLL